MSLDFFKSLQTASWRGIPFGVTASTLRVGRRTATHEYPNRDDVWVEDLGRQGRRIQISGFLLENAAYGGGAVIGQRTQMVTACETAGAGDLVHPSLGRLKVTLTDFEVSESAEDGGAFELRFTFIQSGQQQFPSTKVATQQQTKSAGTSAYTAAASDFVSSVSSLLTSPPIVSEIKRTATALQTSVAAIAGRATNLVAMLTNLPGELGRYVGQYTTTVKSSLTTVEDLIGAAAKSNQAVSTAGTALVTAAASADASDIATAAQTLVQALQSANPDPMTAIKALLELQGDTTTQAQSTSSLTTANSAAVNLYRRAAVTAAAVSSASIKLSSTDDASNLQTLICTALDTEIQTAGDAGEDSSYAALRAVRVAVVQDLQSRAASLSGTQQVSTPRPVPLLVTAQRLYQDASRYDELLQAAQPIHPAFPPTKFRALSK